jgi:hypothetical protein
MKWLSPALILLSFLSLCRAEKKRGRIEKAAIQRRRLAEDDFYPKSGFFGKGVAVFSFAV